MMRVLKARRSSVFDLVVANVRGLWNIFFELVCEHFPPVARWRAYKARQYRKLGLDAYETGDKASSLEEFTKAAEYVRSEPDLACDVAQVAYELKRYTTAEEYFRRALGYDPLNRRALTGLGHTLQAVRRYSEAISAYSRLLQVNSSDAETTFNLAATMHESGDTAAALNFYAKAAELSPADQQILVGWARALFLTGRIEKAIEVIRRALTINPKDSELNRLLGRTLDANGDGEEAAASYRKAIDLDSRNGRAYLDFSNLLDKSAHFGEAIQRATSALEIFQASGNAADIASAYWNLGWLYYHLRDFEKSVAASKSAVGINPRLFGARFNLGLALLYLNREEDARKEYEIGADSVSTASDLKYWAIDDLADALGTDSPPPGGWEVLKMLKARHGKLRGARRKPSSHATAPS